LGVANLAVGAIGGMPVCHGAGGMSAHHAFGARTWRAPVLIGSALVGAALLLGQDLAVLLRGFPLAILAALLLVAGITHVRLLGDLRGWFDWSLALAIGVAGVTGHLLAGVIVGVALAVLVGRTPRSGPAGQALSPARRRWR
jgi:SulP family sulfate permease